MTLKVAKRTTAFLISFSLVVILTAGCGVRSGSAGSGKEAASQNTNPVTLTLYKYYAGLSDKEFDDYFVQPLKQKFPNVTLNRINGTVNGQLSPENMIASGQNVDLIFTSNATIDVFKKLQIATDLNGLIKKTKFDMNRVNPAIVDALKLYSDNGETYAMPFSWNFAGLFYNKDLFDKFGIPYPKNQSTWDDMLQLNRQLTRVDGETQYRGILVPDIWKLGSQLSLPLVDKETNKAVIDTDAWRSVGTLYKQFYENPGMLKDGKLQGAPDFFQDKVAAMFPNYMDQMISFLQNMQDQGQSMNWDMTTYPSWIEQPGVGTPLNFHLLMVSKTSKHPDLAFDIINYLTSDELQLAMTKNGRMTMLDNSDIKSHYGENLSFFKGKNIAGLLKFKPAKLPHPTDFDTTITGVVSSIGNQLIPGKLDINTVFSQAEEQANKVIAEQMAEK